MDLELHDEITRNMQELYEVGVLFSVRLNTRAITRKLVHPPPKRPYQRTFSIPSLQYLQR